MAGSLNGRSGRLLPFWTIAAAGIGPTRGGEGFGDLKRRAQAFAERLRSQAGGRSLLITAHAGPIRMLLAVLGVVELEALPDLSISNRYAGVVVLDDQGRLKDYRVLGQELEASP